MKSLVVFSCLLLAVYGVSPELAQQMQAQMMKLGMDCKSEVDASDDDIAPMLAHQPPNTLKGKCFVACINKKMGFQDASGKVDKEGTYAWLSKLQTLDQELYQKMKQVADNCLSEVVTAADECETALNVYVCVKKEEKVVGLPEMDFNS